MYKVLVVDDEYVIRKSISTRIPWNNMGYILAGTCENGREAVVLLQKEKIDVVLTDISMPYMDGLSLAKYIHENCPRTKTIIISCYDEFEYAKQALHHQVFSYIIKPITAKEMIETLNHVKKSLDEENLEYKELSDMKSALRENNSVLKNQFLVSLLNSRKSSEEINKEARKYGLAFEEAYYAGAYVVFDDVKEVEQNENDITLLERASGILDKEDIGLAFQGMDKTVFLLFYGNKKHSFILKAIECCERLRREMKEKQGVDVSVFLGKEIAGLEMLSNSYEEAKRVSAYQFLMDQSCFLYSEDYSKEETIGDSKFDMPEWKSRIVLAVRSHLKEEIKTGIYGAGREMRQLCLPKNRIILLFQDLIVAVMGIIDLPGVDNEEIYHEEYRLVAKLSECKYLKDAEERLIIFCIQTSECLNYSRESSGKKQAAMAMEYIAKNYADSDLSLQSVCNYLSISISYFSSIFKDYSNETFVEVLTRVRIDKAKELFEMTSMKAYEVASAVGYNDAHYFSAVFKRATGKTPTEYARRRKL